MRCPSCSSSMYEVAPSVFQCGTCGAGDNSCGANPTWALSYVSHSGGHYEATCVEHRDGKYVAYSLGWDVGNDGRRKGIPYTDDTLELEPSELEEFCLPVIVRSTRPWELEPDTVIEAGMFPNSTGPKQVVR